MTRRRAHGLKLIQNGEEIDLTEASAQPVAAEAS